jgi:hypothetical protein
MDKIPHKKNATDKGDEEPNKAKGRTKGTRNDGMAGQRAGDAHAVRGQH